MTNRHKTASAVSKTQCHFLYSTFLIHSLLGLLNTLFLNSSDKNDATPTYLPRCRVLVNNGVHCSARRTIRGAGRVSGQGGQNSAQSGEKNFSFAHPGFQFAHPAIRNGCPPCPPYRGGFKGKGLDVDH